MHLLNAGAYYTKQQYPADFATKTEDDIADGLVQMAAAARLGAYGEFGVANGEAEVDPAREESVSLGGQGPFENRVADLHAQQLRDRSGCAGRHGAAPAGSVRSGRGQPRTRRDRPRLLPRRSQGRCRHRASRSGAPTSRSTGSRGSSSGSATSIGST